MSEPGAGGPGRDPVSGPTRADADAGGATPARPAPAGVAAVLGDDFSVADAVGGVRGLAESVAPGIVFVAVYVATSSLTPALVASVAVTVVAVVLRLVQRTPITQALAGVVGVAIGVFWAWRSGEAQDYFAYGLWTNAAYGVACLVSVLVGWPLVGIVVGLLRGEGTAWRADRVVRRRYAWATWVWVAMFGARLLVQVPLYLGASVGWLGTARLVMGVPLWALTLWVTWLLVRTPGSAPAPSRQPSDP
ncbi:DUF3159 domain-containing protein [Cellulomonas sp. ATA003]|uniref:DUF3159 domain-containing protein n=1 Tax=Cellulomonas sp. ATA003 TaxID=3073064 RepID=UPI002872DEED|nr:DUF3159 domain-containing protein [Cellulomonas sp. ATA003]WNB84435.1 DUF3159 domain-containing protein [Cellulomonas sp. ATA003]